MFGGILDKATGLLDRRFVVGLLLPGLAFWAGVLALVATAWGWPVATSRWMGLSGSQQVLLAGAGVAGLVLFAILVGSQVRTLTRLWEGYWPLAPGRWLARFGTRRQLERMRKLDRSGEPAYTRLYYEFPPSEDALLPTRLGNVLRAAESYPGDPDRYGLDAVFFWPRLYLVLPAETRSVVDDGRSALDQLVVLTTLAVAFPLVAIVVAAVGGLPVQVWLPVVAGTALIALLYYRSAVGAAVVYGDLIRSCYDLHRRDLLTGVGLTPPATLEDERALWSAIQQQLYRRGASSPELIRFAAADSDTSPRH